MDKPKRFRHPLRNEWDQHQPAFARMAAAGGDNAVMARAMLDLIPPFLDLIERERDNRTAPDVMFNTVAAVAGTLIENVIEAQVLAAPMISPRTALHRMLAAIERNVLPQLQGHKVAGIILPPGYGT